MPQLQVALPGRRLKDWVSRGQVGLRQGMRLMGAKLTDAQLERPPSDAEMTTSVRGIVPPRLRARAPDSLVSLQS